MPYLLTRHSFFLCLLLLTGCSGGGHYAPVIERRERIAIVPNDYIVERGDTLFSIAWRYNLDFRRLASTNGVGAPYTIYPGQKIKLKQTVSSPRKVTTTSGGGGSNSLPKVQQKVVKSAATAPAAAPATAAVAALNLDKNRYPFYWRWPAIGKTVRPYSSGSAVHKGIDIQGKLGEPVYAANSGSVVYAGSGLVGYGNLLIIKHDEHYLSAYGHNSQILVNEGELVKVGQKIAEFGDTGTDSVKLHFEIRRDGKPVNPLDLLPRGK